MKTDTERDELFNSEGFAKTVCSHIAQGGSLIELATAHGVRYADLHSFMASDEKRYSSLIKAMSARSEYFIEELKKTLCTLSSLDIRDIYAEDGTIKPVHEWPDALGISVQSIEVNELWEGRGKEAEQVGVTKKIKFWDKTKSIEMLAKHLGMFVDRVSHTHTVSIEDLIEKSYLSKDTK